MKTKRKNQTTPAPSPQLAMPATASRLMMAQTLKKMRSQRLSVLVSLTCFCGFSASAMTRHTPFPRRLTGGAATGAPQLSRGEQRQSIGAQGGYLGV